MPLQTESLAVRLAVKIENALMTRLVPANHPGPLFKRLFKIPLFFYAIGMPLFNDFILLLITTGRKSGKLRKTPLEYRREKGTGYAIITAGWGGTTDWHRNVQADPNVHVQIGRKKFAARAEPLTDAQVVDWLAESLRINPRGAAMFSRWADEPVSLDNPESLLRAANAFPSYRLVPLENSTNVTS